MTTFDELIERGWQRHAEDPQAVADLLEQGATLAVDATQAAALLRLSNHAIGQHLRDWPRAGRLAAAVVRALPDGADSVASLSSLAVAQFMTGAALDALATQARIVERDAADAASALVRIDIEVAASSIDAGALDQGEALYQSALALARAHANPAALRSVAVASNNLASDLLARNDRSAAHDRLLLDAAHAAREFWLKCGTPVNEARAEYLLALAHNAVRRPDTARDHGARALALLEGLGDEKVDEAFTHLALANASRLLGDRPGYDDHLLRADRLAEAFADDGLVRWFADERRQVEWRGGPD
jgi:hypothetical protein